MKIDLFLYKGNLMNVNTLCKSCFLIEPKSYKKTFAHS